MFGMAGLADESEYFPATDLADVELSKLRWKCLGNGPKGINPQFILIFVPQSLRLPLKMVEKKRFPSTFVGLTDSGKQCINLQLIKLSPPTKETQPFVISDVPRIPN